MPFLERPHSLRLGMVWRGNWVAGIQYATSDAVQNGGNSYICIQAHTSSADNEPGTGQYWQQYWNLLVSDCDTVDGYHAEDLMAQALVNSIIFG